MTTPGESSEPDRPPVRRRMLAIDLDGTLLDPGGAISPRAGAALRAARADGWVVVIATGRPPHLVSTFDDDFGGAVSYVVATNGTMIASHPDGAVLHVLGFPADTAFAIVDLLRNVDPAFGFALATDAGFGHESGFAERMPAPVGRAPIPDVRQLGGSQAFKLFAFHPRHTVQQLIADLPAVLAGAGFDGIGVSHMGADAVEIGPGELDKAAGLAWLCSHLGISAGDVVAIGDEWNDISMLRWAGAGVAVANAAPEVLDVADHIAPSNADDGVALVVEALVDGRIRLI